MRTLREFRERLKSARKEHALRHRPSRFAVSMFESIHHVPLADWNDVVPETRPLLRAPYLAALEDSTAGTPAEDRCALAHRYVLLYDRRRPVGAAALQVLDFAAEAVGPRSKPESKSRSLRDHVGEVIRKAKERVALRVLLCGNAFITGEHGFCHVPDLDPPDAFDGLADALYRVRRADKLHGNISAVLVKDFYSEGKSLLPGSSRLSSFGYQEFRVDPQMSVPIRRDWASFDDYVAAMNGKYRRRVNTARRKGKDLVKRQLGLEDIAGHRDRIHELFSAVHEKASFRIAPLPRMYFDALARNLGSDFAMHGYFLADRLVGFASSLEWGGCLEGHYLGLDYEHNVGHAIYQNILYDHVAEAIAKRCNVLNLGRTALEMKSAIGAEPRSVRCYIRHRNPASNAVVRPLFRFAKPTEWTRRNPFE